MYNRSENITYIGKLDVATSGGNIGRFSLGFDVCDILDSDITMLSNTSVLLCNSYTGDVFDKFYYGSVSYGSGDDVDITLIGSYYNFSIKRVNKNYTCALNAKTDVDVSQLRSEVSEIKEELLQKLDRETADTLYAPIGSTGGGGLDASTGSLLCDILEDALFGQQGTYEKITWLRDLIANGGSTPDTPDPPVDDTYWTVTYNLDGYTSENMQTRVTKGDTYTTTLIMDTSADGGSITVTMGGVDVTSHYVNDGFVLIQNVTGNIVITAKTSVMSVYNVISSDRINTLSVYSGNIADGEKTDVNLVCTYHTVEKTSADSSVSVTFKNNTDSAITLQRCYLAEVELPVMLSANSTFVISNAKPYTATIQPNSQVTTKFDVKAGRCIAVTNGVAIDVEIKASSEPKPSYDGWTEFTAAAFNSGGMSWYTGDNDQTTLIKNEWSVTSEVSPVLSAGVYDVATPNSTIKFDRCGVYVDSKTKIYNAKSCFTNLTIGCLIGVSRITVPEGTKLIARQSAGTLAGSKVYYRKVG